MLCIVVFFVLYAGYVCSYFAALYLEFLLVLHRVGCIADLVKADSLCPPPQSNPY